MSCGGANPLFDALNETVADVVALNATVAAALATGACAPEAALRGVQVACGDALDVVDGFVAAAACDRVTPIYGDLVHDALCARLVRGLHASAVGHVAAAALLYAWLYVANYVSETIFLLEEVEDLSSEILATPRHKSRHGARALETELRGAGALAADLRR